MHPLRVDPAASSTSPAPAPAPARAPREAAEDAALLETLHDWLEPGERIETVARPSLSQVAGWSMACWVIFVPWTLFCLDWYSGMGTSIDHPLGGTADHAWQWFRLAALPFLALGISGMALPVWMVWRARDTRHIITDRRELTLEATLATRVVRRHLARIPVSQHDRADALLPSGAQLGGLRPVLVRSTSEPLPR